MRIAPLTLAALLAAYAAFAVAVGTWTILTWFGLSSGLSAFTGGVVAIGIAPTIWLLVDRAFG